MHDHLTARQTALEVILTTAASKDDFRISDLAWTKIVNLAWDGQNLGSDRRSHQEKLKNLIDESARTMKEV